MSICEKIQHIGNTLEDNLNNRGVDCTFGIGTGEQNIYEMAELITKQNLMGIGDANIQIIPNRPYVTSGETIDVTVRLIDGVGNPLINKIITISDGTNSYNGITDKDGIYTLFNQTITTTTTYTVTYGTETASCLVEYCTFTDYAVINNNNTDWVMYNSQNITKTVGDSYTSVTGSNYRYGTPITTPCTIQLEVSKQLGTGNLLTFWTYISSPTSASQLINFSATDLGMTADTMANIELTVGNTSITGTNLDNGTTKTYTYSTTENLIFNFWGTTFKYRNFRIR